MTDDVLLTTDPGLVVNQPGEDRMTLGGSRNEGNNPAPPNGGLSTFVNSEELRGTIDSVMAENRQLRDQLMQLLRNCKPRMAQLEEMRKINEDLTNQLVICHDKSKTKVFSLKQQIAELQQHNEKLAEELVAMRGGRSSVATGHGILEALKEHVQEAERILQQELAARSSRREEEEEGEENSWVEKLMGHIRKAEGILATPMAEMYQGSPQLAKGDPPGHGRTSSPMREQKPSDGRDISSPLSPGGQRDYNQSMEKVLEQLQALQSQEIQAKSALAREREKCELQEARLREATAELGRLRGDRERDVTAAMARQRQEDDIKHKHEMDEMMARLDELTLLAADKHQRHAFEEEPRYHSASNELKQQVTSLINELKQKEQCLREEKAHCQQLMQSHEEAQRKVKMYHIELTKHREEAQSYINTIHLELKRKETLYQSERQKGMHERLENDKYREEIANLQTKLKQLENDEKKFQEGNRNFQEKEDRYVAEILSAEEAIEAKENEKKAMEKTVKKLELQMQLWKEQTNQCQRDFKEERKAREQMHGEKLGLQARLEELGRENRKMEEELQAFHRQQLHQHQQPAARGYGPAPPQPAPTPYATAYTRGGGEFYGPQRQVYDLPTEDEAGTLEPAAAPPYQRERDFYTDLRHPQQVSMGEQRNWCPKCQRTFPDFDTLQIHVSECIE